MSTTQPFFDLAQSTDLAPRHPLYTADQRARRDASVWTLIQGVLAPIQFLVFVVSLVLVVRYLWTGAGLDAANTSVVVKTVTLYTIMVTGCIWEKVVFDCYLFAPAFYWEDVFSMLVLALKLRAARIDYAAQVERAGFRAQGVGA